MKPEIKEEIINKLLQLNDEQGSVSYDEMIDIALSFNLNMSEIEVILKECEFKGVNIREKSGPTRVIQYNVSADRTEEKIFENSTWNDLTIQSSDEYEQIRENIKRHHENSLEDGRKLCALVTRDYQKSIYKIKG